MMQDELYERLQVAVSMLGVLLHELRNPLHGATLLIEAMGMEGADVPALRAKLRGQLRRFEALLGEVGGPMKELALEPRFEWTALAPVLAGVASALDAAGGDRIDIDGPTTAEVGVRTDPVLLTRALVELCIGVSEASRAGKRAAPHLGVTLKMRSEASDEELRVTVQSTAFDVTDELARSPFTLAGGGIHFALARALAEAIGARVRLESSPDGGRCFLLVLRRAQGE